MTDVPIIHGHIVNRPHFVVPRKSVEFYQVSAIACGVLGVSLAEFQGPRGVKRIAYARFFLCTILYELGYSFNEIGQFLGARDHATIVHAINTLREWCDVYPADKALMNQLRALTKDL